MLLSRNSLKLVFDKIFTDKANRLFNQNKNKYTLNSSFEEVKVSNDDKYIKKNPKCLLHYRIKKRKSIHKNISKTILPTTNANYRNSITQTPIKQSIFHHKTLTPFLKLKQQKEIDNKIIKAKTNKIQLRNSLVNNDIITNSISHDYDSSFSSIKKKSRCQSTKNLFLSYNKNQYTPNTNKILKKLNFLLEGKPLNKYEKSTSTIDLFNNTKKTFIPQFMKSSNSTIDNSCNIRFSNTIKLRKMKMTSYK